MNLAIDECTSAAVVPLHSRPLKKEEVGLWLFEGSPDCVKLLDASGRLLRMNRNGQCLMEVDDFSALEGQDWSSLWPPDSRHLVANSVSVALEQGIARFRAFCPTAKGALKFWDVTVTALADEGQLPRLLSVSRDITEMVTSYQREQAQLKEANEELERRVAERTAALQATVQEMEVLSFALAHDLRAPLTSINGFGQMLVESEASHLTDSGRRLLDKIRSATITMDTMIEAVLSLAQIRPEEVPHETVDLSEMAQAAVTMFARHTPERRVRINIAPNLHTTGNRKQLTLVINNLVGNAWKFSSCREDACIQVGSNPNQDGDVEFFVRDNGAGFDATRACQLFKPFHRLHSQKEFSGTGIGLAVVQKVIRLHNGRIWADAVPGGGATFTFTVNSKTVIQGSSCTW